ncbi:MAG: RCC1 domain-containing protein [Steroidobacter sp.]
MVASQDGNLVGGGAWSLALASSFLLFASVASAADESVRRNNLILEGALPQSAVVRLVVSGPGVKEPIEEIIPTPGGALQQGIAAPEGKERHVKLQSFDAEGRILFEGEASLDVLDGMIAPVEVAMKSSLDGSPAHFLLSSHRLAIDVVGVHTKESAVTRIEAKFYDADGRVLDPGADDIQWDINDPWIREHAMPCEGANGPPPPCIQFLTHKPDLTDVAIAACFKEVFCRLVYVPPTPPVWRSISVGLGHHACALKTDGEALCWGQGEHGQLGAVVAQDCEEIFYDPTLHAVPWGCAANPVKVQCPGGACRFDAISAGFKHTCAIDSAQDAWCWGSNVLGEIGNGASDPGSRGDPRPQRVIGGHKFTAISAGLHLTCGLATDHGVYCWGNNSTLTMPNAPRGPVLIPIRIDLLVNALSIDTGFVHVCARATQGRLYCWGANTVNKLLGSDAFIASPYCSNCPERPRLMQFADIPGLVGKFVDIAAAGMSGNCAHVTTGETVCWGTPVPQLPSSANVDRLAFGGGAYCAVISGTAACAGQGKTGVLGDDSFVFSVRGPVVPLPKPSIFKEIDVGLTSACAIGGDDQLYCWGLNDFGKLGNGAFMAAGRPTPVVLGP